MATGGYSNMAAVGNNKSLLWSPQNRLVIFTFKVVEGNILAAFYTYFGSLVVWFAYKHRALDGRSKMAAFWFQNMLISQTMSCSIQSYFWDQWFDLDLVPRQSPRSSWPLVPRAHVPLCHQDERVLWVRDWFDLSFCHFSMEFKIMKLRPCVYNDILFYVEINVVCCVGRVEIQIEI